MALACAGAPAAPDAPQAKPVRVLLVTGGHDFEEAPFYQMFKDNASITFTAAAHTNAHALLRPESAKHFDVLVTYDMHQPISDEAKADFLAFLKAGKGLVVLHHAIASYAGWPEYQEIIGARYYLAPAEVNGVKKARSVYKHDVNFKVKVEDASHPVTKGLTDYEIRDETYNLFDVFPGSKILLVTDEPLSRREIAWARAYGAARVVYIQGGHDHYAYENPNYRKLVAQAIQWVAVRN
jgi:type 1 glutamine amidotransferase